MTISLRRKHFDEIVAHAREVAPHECCGLVGGKPGEISSTVYRTRNVAARTLVSYEASPEDLFAAQRAMRQRAEKLIAIYHSHPHADEPRPSETDVRFAYYPSAVYFIVGLGNREPCLRAFWMSESRSSWEAAEFAIIDDPDH